MLIATVVIRTIIGCHIISMVQMSFFFFFFQFYQQLMLALLLGCCYATAAQCVSCPLTLHGAMETNPESSPRSEASEKRNFYVK